MEELGKLTKVELRSAWAHEAIDFTKWLAKEDNLAILSNEVGVSIILKEIEASVGSFNVDILAEEEGTDNKIIIENQLETTNHDHLGKIITYASGHNAKHIFWIVKDVREEHRQAIDWLNENTGDDINFFAIRMELWKIGDSLPAPKFHIVAKPNDWAKTIKKSSNNGRLTDTKLMQLDFWDKFKEYCEEHESALKPRSARPQHWSDLGIGYYGAYLSLTIDSQKNNFGSALYIPDNKELYYGLEQYKNEIEEEIGEKLDWMELPERKASRIILRMNGDFSEKDKWEGYFQWMKERGELFQRVFLSYIKKVDKDIKSKEEE